jgi:hypothetical protein
MKTPCVCYGMSTKKLLNILQAKIRKRQCEAAFFNDTSNYFSLLNLNSLIERFSSLRNLWEGEQEKIIKYVKAKMNTICDTETFMSGLLNNLLCTHCLDNVKKINQVHEDTKLSKTRDFKLYNSHEAFKKDFSTGKMLLGVIVEMPDGDENL